MMLYEDNPFYHLATCRDTASRPPARTLAMGHLLSARVLTLPCPTAR
ncbi:hypothetical protein KMAL_14980 [Novacetimonas maltaceti]|uniref:Uncharacterized protein n=1 Tax=Novacetimonas maltaceti TaxID=1203393 RepID=A0A2S3W258_9PROT|nr:hypothetical protein KMAL_14980 [Novacetimonas maltaceti]